MLFEFTLPEPKRNVKMKSVVKNVSKSSVELVSSL